MAVNIKTREIDYKKWSQGELIKEIQKLNKREKYGLIWDEEKTKEIFEEEVQKKLPVLKDVTKNWIEDKSKPNNILIEGDNYHALSVLNYTQYLGK
jgi:adenine-specific DNA-methyltransferase